MIVNCLISPVTAAQEKALAYKDEEVKQAFTDINMQHAKMRSTDASLELRMHDPSVAIESEVHVQRAKAMLNMADPPGQQDVHMRPHRLRVERKEPPTFTKALLNATVKEGSPVK